MDGCEIAVYGWRPCGSAFVIQTLLLWGWQAVLNGVGAWRAGSVSKLHLAGLEYASQVRLSLLHLASSQDPLCSCQLWYGWDHGGWYLWDFQCCMSGYCWGCDDLQPLLRWGAALCADFVPSGSCSCCSVAALSWESVPSTAKSRWSGQLFQKSEQGMTLISSSCRKCFSK